MAPSLDYTMVGNPGNDQAPKVDSRFKPPWAFGSPRTMEIADLHGDFQSKESEWVVPVRIQSLRSMFDRN